MHTPKVFNVVSGKIRHAAPMTRVYEWMQKIFPPSICFVSATRMTETEFWATSPLGTSLKPLLNSKISHHICYENKEGLPALYNSAIDQSRADILVFIHDDVWLDDPQLISKIRTGLNHFDAIGVAGNTRIAKKQPAWLFSQILYGKFIRDSDHLSGAIVHGESLDQAKRVVYGEMPTACELLDGVFIAARRRSLANSGVYFDNTFKFDFYDMDFCRTARKSGLTLGTWPLDIIHKSKGVFGHERWLKTYDAYLKKWGE